MGRKNIVVYFRKKKAGADPFSTWGKKRNTYHLLFQKGSLLGFNMYFVTQPENYIGGMRFCNPYLYTDGIFIAQPGKTITADAIYDRSGGLSFPPEPIEKKVLNPYRFKALCADKNATYKLLEKFMPKTFEITSQEEFLVALNDFSPNELAVLKPSEGFGGKDILIDTPAVLRSVSLDAERSYSLQKFVNTSSGIPGITTGTHDLRLVVVDGELVLSHNRTPKPGSYLANVAQGGSIAEVPLEKIPDFILERTREIQAIIDSTFDYPLYSIDFGIDKNTAYVFELNDQIGFPADDMKNTEKFIDNLLCSLIRLTRV